MDKSIRVRILDRDIGLRVTEHTEQATRDIAAYVDARMRSFKQKHPEQPELTAAVVTALAIAEELYAYREEQTVAFDGLDEEIAQLDDQLASVLASGGDRSTGKSSAAAQVKPAASTFEAGI